MPPNLGGLEGTLDVSWAGAVAPNATVKFIVSAFTDTNDPLTLAEEYAVDNNVADIISESFGGCEADMTAAFTQFITSLREQAAAQGITYLVSSGDQGPYTCYGLGRHTGIGPVSVNAFASTPYTIAVGGTGFSSTTKNSSYWAASNDKSTLASALSYIPETAWNDSCGAPKCTGSNVVVASTGGGPSQLFPKPSWQSGVPGIPADGARDVPDVSVSMVMARADSERTWKMMTTSMQTIMIGITAASAVFALTASSTLAPISTEHPAGSWSVIGLKSSLVCSIPRRLPTRCIARRRCGRKGLR